MGDTFSSVLQRVSDFCDRRFRQELGNLGFFGTLGTALAVGFTALGTLGGQVHLPATPSKTLLAGEWNQLRGEMIGQGQERYQSRATIESRLHQIDPSLRIITPDYQRLKKLRKGEAAYIKSVTPTSISLVGRADGGAIVELDASLDQQTEKLLYKGHVDVSLWALLSEIEAGLAFGGGALLVTGRQIRRRREDERRRRAQLADWRRLVPNERFGPQKPQDGFELLEPVKEDEEDGIEFSVQRVQFSSRRGYGYNHGWQPCRYYGDEPAEPAGLEAVTIPHDMPVPEVAERWLDFCGKVADYNAAQWAAARAEREQASTSGAAADTGAQGENDEALRLKAEHLPDASEIIASHPA